jgi:hypothetical protein
MTQRVHRGRMSVAPGGSGRAVTARGAAPGQGRLRGANSESASCTAYEQLIGEGFATGRRGGGTVVAVRPDLTATRGSAGPATPAEQPAPSVAVDLTPGRPATRLLRDTEWRSAWRRAVAHSPPTGLPDPLGVPALREAVAVHLHRARGVEVTADEVLITAGTSDALAVAAIALASPERRPRIVVEDPGYTIARRVLSAACRITSRRTTNKPAIKAACTGTAVSFRRAGRTGCGLPRTSYGHPGQTDDAVTRAWLRTTVNAPRWHTRWHTASPASEGTTGRPVEAELSIDDDDLQLGTAIHPCAAEQ